MIEREAGVEQPASLPKVAAPPAASRARRQSWLELAATICRGALLGTVAVAIGWLLTEAAGTAHASSLLGVAVYVAMLGAVYGLISSAWSDLADRLWSRGVQRAAIGAWVGLLVGLFAGGLAFALYDNLQSVTADPSGMRFYLLRVLAWAVFGAGIGAAPGIAERAPRKVGNGVLGGVIGGALGGAILHWASFHVAAEGDARLLGLIAIGLGIGTATAVVELVRRQAWLRVVAGGMTGKEFVIYHEQTELGSSPKAQITLIKDAAAAPLHARIVDERGRRTIHALQGAVLVNGQSVGERRLHDGDLVQIGSTTLAYAEVEIDG